MAYTTLKVKVLVTRSCLTLCDPMDCSLPPSSVHEIFQARILGWAAISSSRGQECRLSPQDERLLLNHTKTQGFLATQFSSVTQSCLTLCSPMNCSTPGLPVHHQTPEFTQTQVHRVGDAIQPCHPLPSPSPPALNLSQHQSLFQSVNSLHEVAKELELQL